MFVDRTQHVKNNELKPMNIEDRQYIESLTDSEIVVAILHRDARITRLYFYEKCYPLFKSCYDKYYTDCETCVEFINQIYLLVMTPRKSTGVSPLQTFGFRCTLTMWLKIISENYCKQLFKVKIDFSDSVEPSSDRFAKIGDSLEIDFRTIYASDVKKVLEMMPNERYRHLIELRYVEEKTNEETAMVLEMTMDNYYNKHKLAKAQFCNILRKEGLL